MADNWKKILITTIPVTDTIYLYVIQSMDLQYYIRYRYNLYYYFILFYLNNNLEVNLFKSQITTTANKNPIWQYEMRCCDL